MKHDLLKILMLLFILLISPAFAATSVNMSSLLSWGERYDNYEIVVSGYICNNQDSLDGIFLTSEDCRYANYENAIRTVYPDEMNRPKKGLVRLHGIFNSYKDVIKTDVPYRLGEIKVSAIYP